jgi:lipopolysaccharide transport system ATP-binding protein
MYMRLAFAVAANLEPEILLVDEVLAVGDAQFQKKCLGKMGEVAQEGRTVLFVSHNMDAVRKLCQRGILLSTGKILLDGDVEVVLDRYLNESSASLTPCINLPEKALNVFGESLGRATRLSFYSLDGQQKAEFRLWEHWKILLEFEITRPLRHVIAAVGVSTVQGTPVVTYWTEPQALLPGKYQAEFLCDIPLKASDLSIVIGLSEFEKAFYYLPNQGHVAITEISTREQPFRASGAGLLLSSHSPRIVKVE